MALKYPAKQIKTIEDLYESKLEIVTMPPVISNTFNLKIKYIGSYNSKFNKSWLNDMYAGKHAFNFYQIPLISLIVEHSKSLKTKCNFNTLDEDFEPKQLVSISWSKKLAKHFRKNLYIR